MGKKFNYTQMKDRLVFTRSLFSSSWAHDPPTSLGPFCTRSGWWRDRINVPSSGLDSLRTLCTGVVTLPGHGSVRASMWKEAKSLSHVLEDRYLPIRNFH
jgi:hypothetical protein